MTAEPERATLAGPPERAAGPAGGVRGWTAPAGVAALLVLAFACHAAPVADIDLWWHLAAGRWIVERGALPDADPFGVFSGGNPVRTATVLKGQWLGQVALHAAMEAGGALGVALARAGALAAAAALVWLRARRLGAGPAAALAAATIASAALLGFPGERPQVFAFVLAGLTLLSLEEWRRGRRWALAGVAAAGVAWVNVHGSVLIAVAVVAAAALVDAVRAAAGGGGADRAAARRAALGALVLAAATLVSPNGLTTYRYVLETQGGVLAARTTEYASALRIFAAGGWPLQALVLGYLAFLAPGLWRLTRTSPARAAATALLAVASATSYRYHAFLVLLATPWLAAAFWDGAAGRSRRRGPLLALAVALALAGVVVRARGGPLGALREPVAAGTVPAAAVEAMVAGGVEGRALVAFDWAGYVLWAAWPRVVPVVDPRMLDDRALGPYTHMIWATPDGLAALEAARLSAVLLPFRSPTGEVYALHGVLRTRRDWAVEHVWPGGALYRRVR